MKTYFPKISSKGQITLPVEIREYLGVKAHDEVSIAIKDDGSVEMRAPEYTLESVFGSIPEIPGTTADLDKEIEEAMEDFYRDRKQDLRPW